MATYRGADLPAKLAQRWLANENDPKLLSLEAEIRMVHLRLGQLAEKHATEESAHAWANVARQVEDMRTIGEKLHNEEQPLDRAAIQEQVAAIALELDAALHLASSERSLWHELFETMEVLRRLNDTERKREESLQVMLMAKDAVKLLGAVMAAISDEVRDTDVRQRLVNRLRVLLTGSGVPQLAPGKPLGSAVIADAAIG